MSEHSLKKRYFWKLLSNLIGLVVGFLTISVVPRALGPAAFGDFNFLTTFFARTTSFLDMGTSQCFFAKLSQRQADRGIVSFYLRISLIILVAITAFVTIAWALGIAGKLWPDQNMVYVWIAALLAYFMWASGILWLMGDAYGVTVSAEKMRMLQKVISGLAIVALFAVGRLNLASYFSYQLVITLVLIGVFLYALRRVAPFRGVSLKIDASSKKSYIREFSQYSHPLVTYYIVVVFLAEIGDRWILQRYGGNVQQGFFGFSSQLSSISLLFTVAMVPLLMREFSIAHGMGDLEKMAALFRRYIPMLYAISAFFACFIAVQADKVVVLMGGEKYKGAVVAVAVMAFFSMLQTYGQLSGQVFFATGKTSLYRNIGILFGVLGLPVTYFMVAPVSSYGLAAGATGLALKTIIITFLAVNVQLWFNARMLSMPFWKLLFHQLGTAVIFTTIALMISKSMDMVISSMFVSFLVSGMLYTVASIGVLLIVPSVFSVTRGELLTNINKFGQYMKQCLA